MPDASNWSKVSLGRLLGSAAAWARGAGRCRSRNGPGRRGSTLLVRVEDVVLRLHRRMARVSAVGEAFGIGRELVRCDVVVEHRVSPPAGFRKSLAVFFHHEGLGKEVWHVHGELGLRTLLLLPLELHDHGALRERLAVAGNTGLVRRDHLRIGDDYLKYFVLPRGRDHWPVLVSSEVGERDPARRYK